MFCMMLPLLVELVSWIFLYQKFKKYPYVQCNQKRQHHAKHGICASWYTYLLHVQIFSWFYVQKWSHVISFLFASNCLFWSLFRNILPPPINSINWFKKNLNWQCPQNIHNVHHKYFSEYTESIWGQNTGCRPKPGYCADKSVRNIFQRSKTVIPCGFARGIQWTNN